MSPFICLPPSCLWSGPVRVSGRLRWVSGCFTFPAWVLSAVCLGTLQLDSRWCTATMTSALLVSFVFRVGCLYIVGSRVPSLLLCPIFPFIRLCLPFSCLSSCVCASFLLFPSSLSVSPSLGACGQLSGCLLFVCLSIPFFSHASPTAWTPLVGSLAASAVVSQSPALSPIIFFLIILSPITLFPTILSPITLFLTILSPLILPPTIFSLIVLHFSRHVISQRRVSRHLGCNSYLASSCLPLSYFPSNCLRPACLSWPCLPSPCLPPSSPSSSFLGWGWCACATATLEQTERRNLGTLVLLGCKAGLILIHRLYTRLSICFRIFIVFFGWILCFSLSEPMVPMAAVLLFSGGILCPVSSIGFWPSNRVCTSKLGPAI